MDRIKEERKIIIDCHRNDKTPYYNNAEKQEWMDVFWSENSVFLKMFNQLNKDYIMELACGHGRHVKKYVDESKKIILVDVLDENLEFCKNRLERELTAENYKKIDFYKCNGIDVRDISSESLTAIFSYDAMVHFELLDIYSYLNDCYRVLKKGGRCLFHHSNLHDNYKVRFSNSVHYRNYMSQEIFAYMCDRVGFEVLDQKVIDWGLGGEYVKNLDCITLVEK